MSEENDELQPEESTENEEQPTEQEQLVQQALQEADQFHQIIDQAKVWSRETYVELLIEAGREEDDETSDELAQIAAIVKGVGERIEQGDNTRARQPSVQRP